MEKGEKFLLIVLGFLTFLAICYKIQLAYIRIARLLFWSSLTISIIVSILLIYFIYVFFTKKEDYLFNDLAESWLIALICVGGIIIFYFFAGACYNAGYSENAIKAEKEALAYLQDYNIMMNLPYQIIEETIDSNCKDPNYPCEQVKKTYQTYKSFIWWKSKVDSISKIMVTVKKIDNSIK